MEQGHWDWAIHPVRPPAVSTDVVYLYLLNSRYSRISSLISRFSWDSGGRGSPWSSRALNTSALIPAFSWAHTPRDSSVSLIAEIVSVNEEKNKIRYKWWSSDTATESWGWSVVNLIIHRLGDKRKIFNRMRLVWGSDCDKLDCNRCCWIELNSTTAILWQKYLEVVFKTESFFNFAVCNRKDFLTKRSNYLGKQNIFPAKFRKKTLLTS